jgi:hypothetical protein
MPPLEQNRQAMEDYLQYRLDVVQRSPLTLEGERVYLNEFLE